ncbi:MAG TPA: helix-turn-helix domain-containing protein [Nocardioidaceae bacterium]|nr:helix-turn-helix domain-containing protein [Nocardioidaceae bacterium]
MAASRPYRSDLRNRQAAGTRRAILQAARELFAGHGYAPTTINEIAATASVSAQTVYAAFTSKAGLALALVDYTNEQSGVEALAGDVRTARTPQELVRASIHLVCVLHERIGDLIRVLTQAAQVDPALAPALAAGRASHAEPQKMIAHRLAAAGALRGSVSVDTAVGLLTVCTSPEAVERYVTELRWSYARVEDVLTGAMLAALCQPAAVRRPLGPLPAPGNRTPPSRHRP